MAEYLYKLSLFKHSESHETFLEQESKGIDNVYGMSLRLRHDLIQAGDSFMERIRKHTAEGGSMSERKNFVALQSVS